jgi:hypothetical protein
MQCNVSFSYSYIIVFVVLAVEFIQLLRCDVGIALVVSS